MQITIVQAEIETAIRNYVGSLLTVAPGTQIEIDLRAGRGEAGYTATVDLIPEGQTKQVAIPKVTKAAVEIAPVAETAAAETPASGDAAGSPGKSLFAGLSRPVNAASETAAAPQ